MPQPLTLVYFPIRARGELIRLFLVDSGIEWADKRVEFDDEWKNTLKAQAPFEKLPVLEVDDTSGSAPFVLPETTAALQYIEDRCCMIPRLSERSHLLRAKVTAIKEQCLYHIDKFWDFYYEKNWTDLDALQRRVAQSYAWFERITKLLENLDNGNDDLFRAPHVGAPGTGTTLTAAAVVLFETLELFDNQFPGALEKYPRLAAIHSSIRSRPRIAEYLASGKRPGLVTLSPYETVAKHGEATEKWKNAKTQTA
ncbi:hypothetical protein AURDEDRAFT_111004 [Auricularia subglabra TFB-10046 SS5]|nr:hypothetical protein AURDEDRAFT_111004 [Auricularia subglabra TFB-10046 SS5]